MYLSSFVLNMQLVNMLCPFYRHTLSSQVTQMKQKDADGNDLSSTSPSTISTSLTSETSLQDSIDNACEVD